MMTLDEDARPKQGFLAFLGGTVWTGDGGGNKVGGKSGMLIVGAHDRHQGAMDKTKEEQRTARPWPKGTSMVRKERAWCQLATETTL